MGLARRKRLFERATKTRAFDLSNASEKRHVGKILHAGVRTLARKRVGMKLLGDVGLDRIEAERGWCDASEAKDIVSNELLDEAINFDEKALIDEAKAYKPK